MTDARGRPAVRIAWPEILNLKKAMEKFCEAEMAIFDYDDCRQCPLMPISANEACPLYGIARNVDKALEHAGQEPE